MEKIQFLTLTNYWLLSLGNEETMTEMEQKVLSERKDIGTDIEDTPTTKISVVTVETNMENIPKAEILAQCSVDTSASNDTPEKEMKNVDAQTCENELVDKNQIIDEMLTKMEKFNSSDLSRVLTKVADLMKKL